MNVHMISHINAQNMIINVPIAKILDISIEELSKVILESRHYSYQEHLLKLPLPSLVYKWHS